MSSFKSVVFNFIMRKRHLFKGKLKKETFDMNTSIEDFRNQCEKGASKYAKIPDDIKIQEIVIDGLLAEWIIPENASSKNIILYIHGGGYVSGSCNDHRGFVSKFAKICGVKTLQFEYRLAPEHKFPAALEDSINIYKWLLDNDFKSQNIIFAGESAGGGLTLALLLALRDNNIELPKAAVAISPWTDLTCSSDSYSTKNKVSVAPLNSWLVFSKHYVRDQDAKLPYISPLFGDLKGLPPIFINSSENDELYEDGKSFYLKAKKEGVDIKFRSGENMVHCYPLLAPFFKEATEALSEIAEFIKTQFNVQQK